MVCFESHSMGLTVCDIHPAPLLPLPLVPAAGDGSIYSSRMSSPHSLGETFPLWPFIPDGTGINVLLAENKAVCFHRALLPGRLVAHFRSKTDSFTQFIQQSSANDSPAPVGWLPHPEIVGSPAAGAKISGSKKSRTGFLSLGLRHRSLSAFQTASTPPAAPARCLFLS